jgi:hypothetical protein
VKVTLFGIIGCGRRLKILRGPLCRHKKRRLWEKRLLINYKQTKNISDFETAG